jgi:hypothetical protein
VESKIIKLIEVESKMVVTRKWEWNGVDKQGDGG